MSRIRLKNQYITSPKGGTLGINIDERHSDCDRKIIQWLLNWDSQSGRVILLQDKTI